MSIYKITVMLEEEPNQLFPHLIPLQFRCTEKGTITWSDNRSSFKIVPFSSKGRGLMGYRIYFTGDPKSGQDLMERALGSFNPKISGIEWVSQTDSSQEGLIQKLNKLNFEKGSMRGIYRSNGVGIVALPSGEINVQIRCKLITTKNLAENLSEIEGITSKIIEKPIDLFSFNNDERIEKGIV